MRLDLFQDREQFSLCRRMEEGTGEGALPRDSIGTQMKRLPLVTITISTLSALIFLLPGAEWLEYDRNAILSGEWWRIVTGHWVHFSARHFLYDTAAFGIAGWMIETRGCRHFGWLCALAVFVISGSMLLFDPHLQICGGLSGLATAAVVFLALNGLEERGPWRWICMTALLLCAAKLALESATGSFVVLRAASTFAPVPANHIAGAFTALAVYAWPRVAGRLRVQRLFTG
jgi:rhomboid family GlyGly-CTERM serine protease